MEKFPNGPDNGEIFGPIRQWRIFWTDQTMGFLPTQVSVP